jgi:putative ATPase
VFVLKPLDEEAIVSILRRALTDADRGLGREQPEADDEALRAMARFANGDARAALNLLQLTVAAAPQPAGRPRIDRALLEQTLTNKMLLYDKSGEEHYNLMSALHKSMRNSDADASIYWLARMLEAGEDPKYVARRLIRFASEDVGNADPQALAICVAAKDAVHFIGMPEGNTALAQAAIYLAAAPKSNAVYRAYLEAADAATNDVAEPVPLHLRNAPTKLMKELGYGRDYRYAHDEAEGIADMECLPPAHRGRVFYEPTDRGFEMSIRNRLEQLQKTPTTRASRSSQSSPSGTSPREGGE